MLVELLNSTVVSQQQQQQQRSLFGSLSLDTITKHWNNNFVRSSSDKSRNEAAKISREKTAMTATVTISS